MSVGNGNESDEEEDEVWIQNKIKILNNFLSV